MKKYLFTAAVITSLSFLSNAMAAGDIGVLDVEKIVKESTAMKDIQNKVGKKQEEYQKEISKEESKLEAEKKAVEGKKSTLSKANSEKQAEAFEKKVESLRSNVERKQNILKKSSLDAMSKINDKIKEIVTKIAKDKGLSVVTPSSQVVYFDAKNDITEEVLKMLNKEITKVDVKFE